MGKQVAIIFANDEKVQQNENLKHVVHESPKTFQTLFIDGDMYVVVKSVSKSKQTSEKVRMISGDIARELSTYTYERAFVDERALSEAFSHIDMGDCITAFVEGWHLGAYQFITYKSQEEAFVPSLQFNNEQKVSSYVTAGKMRARATAFARDLMNEVPNALNPETFPNVLKEKFANTNVDVHVHDVDALEEMEMNGILSVCRGSKHSPALVELTYRRDESKPSVALVGKGVTFDTGGISLKGSRDLSDMRMDMGGAAAVAGAMHLLQESQANVNVSALIPIVENMPDNQSMLPGEVIRFKNGHTVQVGNTDAEGRLILADGLLRAGELGAEYVVDIATLTGAIARALGSRVAGIFGDDKLCQEMKQIGDDNGDFVWPMPLVDAYDHYLNSDYADFCNISTKGEAGAIVAALFLRRFVPEQCQWVHVDMAGVMERNSAEGYYPKSATGFGVRLLADFIKHISS